MKLSLLLSYQDPSTQHSVIFICVCVNEMWHVFQCDIWYVFVSTGEYMLLWMYTHVNCCVSVCALLWVKLKCTVRRVNVVKIALVSPEAPEEMGAMFTPTHLSHTYPLTLILNLLHIAIYTDHWGPNSDDLLMFH